MRRGELAPTPTRCPQLRVAMVSEHASPLALLGGVDAGGQNVHVAELARHLAQLGAEVTVLTRRDDPSLPDEVGFAPGVVVRHVDAGPAIPLPKDALWPHMDRFAAELARLWAADRPDVVHAHFWMSGDAALRAARPLGVPVALTLHALGSVKRRFQRDADTSPAARAIVEPMVAGAVDLLLATAEDELRELQRCGVGTDHAVVVPCGVDLTTFRPADRSGRAGGPDGAVRPDRCRPRVLVLGRLVERKGIADVISAMVHVPDADLVVAGGPPAAMLDHDPAAIGFTEVAEQLGVADRVDLLGAVPREQVPALLRSADVVVCCPWYEPFGMVAVEAMACGVPVVASRVGGLAETVLDGETGLLVAPRSPREIAAAVNRLLADRARSRMMTRAGVHRAQQYGWHAVAAQTYGQLQALVRRHQAAASQATSSPVGQ